jgi:hypothetical protein
MSKMMCLVAVVVLGGCVMSATATRAAATVGSPLATVQLAHGRTAANWDIDGDGRRDHAHLVYLGGNGPDNWKLVVDMTSLGRQAVRFTAGPVLPGDTGAPTIAGSVDADRDGHAEIFVKVDAGASTQFWTIFKLAGKQIRQVTSQGRQVRLAVGGSVTHQDGFRCDGAQFVVVGEGTNPPAYTSWTYERDTFAWSGAKLVRISKRTGQVTSNPPGNPPSAYSGVSCGGLPQLAPPHAPL